MGRTARWVAVLAAVVVSVAFGAPVAAGAAQADLVEQVTQAARDRLAGGPLEAEVRVLRSDDRQAYGTVVLVPAHADAVPRDWLFVAERAGAGWRVALDGQLAFAELAARSAVLSAKERTVFAAHSGQAGVMVNGDYRTGMRLPWAVGQTWTVLGGPHAHDAGSGPWSSVDLAGATSECWRRRRPGVAGRGQRTAEGPQGLPQTAAQQEEGAAPGRRRGRPGPRGRPRNRPPRTRPRRASPSARDHLIASASGCGPGSTRLAPAAGWDVDGRGAASWSGGSVPRTARRIATGRTGHGRPAPAYEGLDELLSSVHLAITIRGWQPILVG